MAYTKDEWWHTTPAGARIGWLQPPVFLQQVKEVCMGWGSQGAAPMLLFAEWVGVGKSTVYRWANATDPIPKWVALMLKVELQLQESGIAYDKDVEADWLPYTDGANGRQRPVTPPDGGGTKYDGTTHEGRLADSDLAFIHEQGYRRSNFGPSTPPDDR